MVSPKSGTVSEVKMKKKCGRPRNPIPRHKRVSHINAEHRRRGKIQNGFQTLKNMVPKYETSSGRDSKADILFKAVEHSRQLQAECSERKQQIEKLRRQRQALNAEIERHQTHLPERQLFEEHPPTPDQRLEEYIKSRTSNNYRFWIFGFFMRHLHKSFEKVVNSTTTKAFANSVIEWANQTLSKKNLHSVVTESLRDISIKTSFITQPEQLYEDWAREQCNRSVIHGSDSPIHIPLHLSDPEPEGKLRLTISKTSKPKKTSTTRGRAPCLKPLPIETDSFQDQVLSSSSCINNGLQKPVATDLCPINNLYNPLSMDYNKPASKDSYLSSSSPKSAPSTVCYRSFLSSSSSAGYESGSPVDSHYRDSSPPSSIGYESSSTVGDFNGHDTSSLDAASLGTPDSPLFPENFHNSPFDDHSLDFNHSHPHQNTFFDPSALVHYECVSPESIQSAIKREYSPSCSSVYDQTADSSPHQDDFVLDHPQEASDTSHQFPSSSSLLTDPADRHYLFESFDKTMPSEPHERNFFDTDPSASSFMDMFFMDCDVNDLTPSLSQAYYMTL